MEENASADYTDFNRTIRQLDVLSWVFVDRRLRHNTRSTNHTNGHEFGLATGK